MSNTKTFATIIIFVVCTLYVLALLVIGIRFVVQYLRFLRGSENNGEIHWRQATGETPRNSFLHELRINSMPGRRRMEPPPPYVFAVEEAPPSYEDCEKTYQISTISTNVAMSPKITATSCVKLQKLEAATDSDFPSSTTINIDNEPPNSSSANHSINNIKTTTTLSNLDINDSNSLGHM